MGGQPKNVTQTNVTKPPKYLLPSLEYGASQLIPAYERSGQDYAGLRSLLSQPQPDLSQQIQQQYLSIQPGVQSRFALSGRSGSGLEQNALGEAFGNVALQNISQDRARRLQEAEALAGLEYQRLGGFGGLLGAYTPGGSTSSTQPYFRGSGLGGAVGGLVGGIGGALLGQPQLGYAAGSGLGGLL